ncbi:MAG: GNAT family N-acetyltransferase [Pedobacter sp.]|nr:GNAT family N-acetyltransferase [Chitinophagaceae bacterium]
MQSITIRTIQPQDNSFIAKIIRNSLEEFGANKPGTVYFDDSTDHLYELFNAEPKSHYFIALVNDEVVGGGGLFPTEALPTGTCELVKMYLQKEYRGIGLGKKMMHKCLEWAKENGCNQVYLETMPELKNAVAVYEKLGFQYLTKPMGNSGHNGCDIWMLKGI